jgi:hypothetical protein
MKRICFMRLSGSLIRKGSIFSQRDLDRGRGLTHSLKRSPVIPANRRSLSYEKKSGNRKRREADDP